LRGDSVDEGQLGVESGHHVRGIDGNHGLTIRLGSPVCQECRKEGGEILVYIHGSGENAVSEIRVGAADVVG
jgi:hypothetical protein